MGANSLTNSIVKFLNFNGFKAWNVYNGAIYDPKKQIYRKNPQKKKGVFDICGFRIQDGRHLEIEIKVGKDRLSDYQKRHLADLEKAGALCFVARNFDEFLTWYNTLTK